MGILIIVRCQVARHLDAVEDVNDAERDVYLKATLEAIARGHPNDRLDDLLPWNFHPVSS